MSEPNEWSVPDWHDASAYPKPDGISDQLWRWEFIRRMPDYRDAWDRASKVEYQIRCRMAEEAQRDKSNILQSDDLCFVVSIAVMNNPDEYQDLIKYDIQPFYNPRTAVPRLFRGAPSVMHLRFPRYSDEHGGHFISTPQKHWRDPLEYVGVGLLCISI